MKITKIVLIIASVVFTIANLIAAIKSPNVVNLMSFLGIIPIVSSLYSEIDWIYISWNKIKAYFFLKTVSFIPKSSRYIGENISIDQLEKNVRRTLIKYGYSIDEAFIKRTEEDLYFKIDKNGIKSELTANIQTESSGSRLTIKIAYQLAYRDVNKFWDLFLLVRHDLFSQFAKTSSSKERYDITISTDNSKNFNPFYRLTVRHVGESNIKSFNLKFTDGNLSVTTNMNKIYGTSDNYKDIEKLIKEYIPLSKLT